MLDRRKVDKGILLTGCWFWIMAFLLLVSCVVVLYLVCRPL